MSQDGIEIWKNGMLYGYTLTTVGVVLTQAAGGLIVAMVVMYADNILKGFATSLSIIISSAVSFYLSGTLPSWQFASGTLLVLFSVYLYSSPN